MKSDSTNSHLRMLGTFLLILTIPTSLRSESVQARLIDHKHFRHAKGAMVVWDERQATLIPHIHNQKRSSEPFPPASTFKIPHTLFALDAGLVLSPSETIAWDGKKRALAAWNQDQTLQSAMQNSTVWVFESFAKQLGEKREQQYLHSIEYGNCNAAGPSPFWIKGQLAINAQEQVQFLHKLYHNNLPFQNKHLEITKQIMFMDRGENWVLRGKTGWTGNLAWWIGWVEQPEGPVFFALNIDTPRGKRDLPHRESIAKSVLRSLNALPPLSEYPTR